nr:uncharacterized protein LOC113723714 [Coffea arabica]
MARVVGMNKKLQLSYMQQAAGSATSSWATYERQPEWQNRRSNKHRECVGLGAREMMKKPEKPSWWVPHPRSGIYYPQGHERVMEDVPNGAASFGDATYWLRSVDGVDKPEYDMFC